MLLSERGFYLSTTSSVVLGEAFEELGLVQALWPFVIIESSNWCVWSGCEDSEKEEKKKCHLTSFGDQLPFRTSLPSFSHASTFSMVASSSLALFNSRL